jgi:hypothetical protein
MRKSFNSNTPYRNLWFAFACVSLNTWCWSTVFHAKDTFLTEIMDYFSAFGLVLFQFNAFFVRYLYKPSNLKDSMRATTKTSSDYGLQFMYFVNISSLAYYLYHIYYLSSISFDYGYNMKVNIFVGILNSICWISWSIDNYVRKKRTYVWRCALSVFLFDVLMILEIFDFSPLFWTLDSHALWHFSTIIIPFYWYRFIIDDCNYIQYGSYNNNKKIID